MCRAPVLMSGGSTAPCASITTGTIDGGTSRTDALPHETTLHLLDFLDAVSLAQCAQTYAAWRKLASTDLLWQGLCKSEFGIDGGKTDYAIRWKQEKHHALANLQLYVDFLDEIFFALGVFFALVSLFIVFPTLLVLKIDGWFAISWTQVFCSIYGLGFIAVLFVLVRVALLATVFSPHSSLKSCISYCRVAQVAKCVIVNRDVLRKVVALATVPTTIAVIPFTVHLFVDGYLPSLRLAAMLVWVSVGAATYYAKRMSKIKRTTHQDWIFACTFAASSLMLAKATVAPVIPWCATVCPFAVLPALAAVQFSLQHAMFKRFYGRPEAASVSLRHLSSTDASTNAALYYQHYPPLVSLALLALKLDGVLSCFPWALVMVDYIAWVVNGPVALYARQLIQVMFREMPVPANLRKL